jgi:hypothetical protein
MQGDPMKLLICLECGDIVKLFPERRTCNCGKSWGQYLEDHSTTVQSANSRSLGIANADFTGAFQALAEDPERFSPLLCFRGWLNPNSETDVLYAEEVAE